MNPDQAIFRRRDRDGSPALAVTGEIDLVTAARFEEELAAVISDANSPAFIDLSEVTFIDSSGLHVLIRARKHTVGTEVRLVLLNPSEACRRVLEITNTNQLFEIATRPDEDQGG